MIHIAICDDDKIFSTYVKEHVNVFCRQNFCDAELTIFSDSTILEIEINEDVNKFDLYILDIEMPKLDGFMLAKKIRDKSGNKIIIFLTSHKKYAIDAYELDILRYIPKKEMEGRLDHALELAFKNVADQTGFYLHEKHTSATKIFFDSIIYVDKYQKNCLINLIDKKESIKIRKTLQEFYAQLDPELFLFANRGMIVNTKHIKEIAGANLVLDNGILIPIGKEFRSDIQERINKYWCGVI